MERISGSRWADALSGRYSHKPSSYLGKSSIYLGKPKLPKRLEGTHQYSFMFDKVMPLSNAVEGYDLFDNMKAQKVVFEV
jgi:hypothetical protein